MSTVNNIVAKRELAIRIANESTLAQLERLEQKADARSNLLSSVSTYLIGLAYRITTPLQSRAEANKLTKVEAAIARHQLANELEVE